MLDYSKLYHVKSQEAKELMQAWGDWLRDMADWNWFATLTFRDPEPEEIARGYTKRGEPYARAAWRKFVGQVPMVLGEPTWVRMFEYQHWRGVPHIHALVAGVDDQRRDSSWAWWFKNYGFARILPYDKHLGAGYYLCKYVTKDLGDIDFSRNLTKKVNSVNIVKEK